MESLKSLVSVASRVLREERKENVHEDDANKNVVCTLKRFYLSLSHSSSAGSTSKRKGLRIYVYGRPVIEIRISRHKKPLTIDY